MWQDTPLTRRLGLRAPIVQGPFGGGLSSVDLLAAVCEAGGLGSYGVNHLASAQILSLTKDIRARTGGPFALNLWVSDHDPGGIALSAEDYRRGLALYEPYYRELGIEPPPAPLQYGQRFEEQIEAVLALRPAVFSFVYGVPPAYVLQTCRARDILTLGAVTSIDEAIAMEQAGVDMVVATGFEAGGHRVSFLRPAEDSLTGTFALVPTVVDAVSIPVIAAGGIADGRGIAAALTLGAAGVQIGTAFLACEESNASALHRSELFSERARYTALTRAYTGRLARGLESRLADAAAKSGGPLFPYPAQAWFTRSLKQAALAQGRSDLLALWSGQAAPLLRDRHATALFERLVRETGALLDASSPA